MPLTVHEVVAAAQDWTPAQRREVLARLWPEHVSSENDTWISVRFSEAMQVVAYTPEQEEHVQSLRDTLLCGALARVESQADGTYEVYGVDRTYYVTMTPKREFAALLSSWVIDAPPRELTLPEAN